MIGVDPAGAMLRRAAPRITAASVLVALEILSGEDLPFGEAISDSVVCTFSLGMIPDPAAALAEMRRFRKP